MKLFLIALVFISCSAEKKLSDVAIKRPDLLAKYCVDTYPVTAKTDSTNYLNSKRVIDSLADELLTAGLIYELEKEGLAEELGKALALLRQDPNCDSLSEPLYRLAAKEQSRAEYLETQNKNLIKAAKGIKPVIDTVINNAALGLCGLARDAALRALDLRTKEVEKWKARAKKRRWIIAGLIAVIGLYAIMKFKKIKI